MRAAHQQWIGAVLIALCCAVPATGQKLPRWKIDPYTRNDPDQMAKLGYVSYGPFEFGQRGSKVATTTDIEELLVGAEFLWVETAHFRIGQLLPAWPVPTESATKKKIRGELERLAKSNPRFKPKTRVLKPWTRLHLTALRMEDLYAEFEDLLGVSDSDFPKSVKDVIAGRGRFMGYGPYLGQQGKYLVFVTEHSSTFVTYQATFIGKTSKFGQRWHFTDKGNIYYGVATEMEGGRLKHDTALHGDLVFNVAQNLIDGFRQYAYDMPVWIREGIGHYFQRRVTPRWNSFSQNESNLADKKPLWRWRAETRKLLARGDFTPFAEMYTWRDYSQIKFDDHILLWSRWDFLMSLGKEKFAEFIFGVKGRVDPETWLSDQRDLVGATRTALRKAYGLTPLNFDDKWREWVLANYPSK